LIVEGVQDCHVFFQIAVHNSLENSFGIWDGGGDEGALKKFSGLLAASRRPAVLGIVLDSDPAKDGPNSGAIGRWGRFRGRLAKLPYQLPDKPDDGGAIFDGPDGYPRIGVWLMPDNRSDGMLEDFLLSLIPNDAKEFADFAAKEAKLRDIATFQEVHHSKAVVHTYLAWQDEPGKPLGLATRAGMFDVKGENAKAFVDWLKAMFSPVVI